MTEQQAVKEIKEQLRKVHELLEKRILLLLNGLMVKGADNVSTVLCST